MKINTYIDPISQNLVVTTKFIVKEIQGECFIDNMNLQSQ